MFWHGYPVDYLNYILHTSLYIYFENIFIVKPEWVVCKKNVNIFNPFILTQIFFRFFFFFYILMETGAFLTQGATIESLDLVLLNPDIIIF